MGIAIIALLVLNLISFTQLRQIQAQQASLLSQVEDAQAALAMLSSPNVQMLSLNEENVPGTILLDKEHNKAVLIAQDLPALAENQIYQIWLIQPNEQRVSAGLFNSRAGQWYTTESFYFKEDVSNFIGIGVTIEPVGGSDQPTGSRVFRVDF
jgi:anti-sigma-K factor RskA